MPAHDLTTVEGLLSALSINPAWSPDRREEAINLECAKHNALVEIADALNCASPSSIARAREIVSAVWALKHKSPEVAAVAQHDGGLAEELKAKIASNVADAAARDMRIADLERIIEATHKVFDGVGVAWSVGGDAGRLTLPKRAEYAVAPGFLAGAERKALETQIAGLVRDLAAKDASLKTANAALNDIADAIGAPPPVCPDDVVDEVRALLGEVKRSTDCADRAEATLAETVKALDYAGAPRHYLDDDGRESAEVPAAERVRILAEIARSERVLREQTERNAAVSRDHLSAVALTLDDAGAPRHAGVVTLSPAARVRALAR